MKWKTADPQKRLYLVSALILLVGLGSSLGLYLTAGKTEIVFGYEIAGGKAYLITPENSKRYVHDLKLIGGNAAVFADEFSRWFIGLWHGKSLAFTVACITIFISLGFFFVARLSPSDLESGTPDEKGGREGIIPGKIFSYGSLCVFEKSQSANFSTNYDYSPLVPVISNYKL